MADPLSISASVLAIVTAAIMSTKSLHGTVQRFRDRDKSLRRLIDQLNDLTSILNALHGVSEDDVKMLELLKGPVGRCSQLCREFESAMKSFAGKSQTGFRDWSKMEFMRGDINEFMDTLSGYKSTISVGLGTITLQTSKTSHQILEQYSEMVQDTVHELNVHLQRIDEKMDMLTAGVSSSSDIDFEDERAVTKHCISICEDAITYIQDLAARTERSVPGKQLEPSTNEHSVETYHETRKVLTENRDSIAKMIGRLQERLDSLNADAGPGTDQEKARLVQDIEASEQSLEVCRLASGEVSRQKVHIIGEATADGDSDQVVVTTMADLFDVKKALSRGRSAQLIGSMANDTLLQLSKDRYSSRFGTPSSAGMDIASPQSAVISARSDQHSSHQGSAQRQRHEATPKVKASSNEVRRRATPVEQERRDAGHDT